MTRRLAYVLLLSAPLYRYARAVVGIEAIEYLPFILEAFLIGVVTIKAGALYARGRIRCTALDRLALGYAVSVLLQALLIVLPKQGLAMAVDFLRVFWLPIGMYGAVRVSIGVGVVRLIDLFVLIGALTIVPLMYEFAAYNIWHMSPDAVLFTRYWAERGHDLALTNPTYLNPESYQLPFFGNAIRPFGPLGAPQDSGVFYLLCLVYVLCAVHRPTLWRWLVGLLLGTSMLLTMSRTAWGTFVLVLALLALRHVRRTSASVRSVMAMCGALVVLVLALAVYYVVANLGTVEGGLNSAQIFGIFGRDTAMYWHSVVDDLVALRLPSILFGHGHGYSFGSVEAADNPLGPDVVVFSFIYTLGVVGVALLMAVFLRSLFYARRRRGAIEPVVRRAWPLICLVLVLSNIHYQSLFRYGTDVFIMALLGYLSWERAREFGLRSLAVPRAHTIELPHQPELSVTRSSSAYLAPSMRRGSIHG